MEEFEREFGVSKVARLLAFIRGPRLVRRVLLQRVLAYWTARQWLNKGLFRLMRGVYRLRTWGRDARAATSLFALLTRAIAGQVLFACALVAVAVGIERLVRRYTGFQFQLYTPAPATGGAVPPPPPGVRDVLNTIAQIAGIVLTLYYTALSVVISTAYAKVATDLRTLIVREKSSYLYVKLLALTCAGSLILLGVDSFGIPIAGLPFLIVLFASVLSVLSFVSLGLNAFRFFDPAVLVHQLTEDFALAARAATSRSAIALQPSFQNYFRQQAASALATYGEVLSACAEPPHHVHLGALAVRLAEMLRAYGRAKVRIDSESLWFVRTAKHPRWLLSSESNVVMALNTGTTLQPKMVANPEWVEQAVGQHITRALELALKGPDSDGLHLIASSTRRAAAHLSDAGDIAGALRLCQEAYTALSEKAPDSVPPEQELEWLAAHEELCLASIDALLGFRRFVERLADGAAVRAVLAEAHATGHVANDPPLLPAQLASALRRHRDHLQAEQRIEGELHTPGWYTTQILAAQLLRHIALGTAAIIGEIEAFVSRCTGRAGRLRTLMSAQAGQRGLELVSKMEPALDRVAATCQTLATLRRTEEESWSDPPLGEFAARLAKARESLAISIARLAASVAAEQEDEREDRPDYFGFTYTIAAQECFAAMVRADERAFAQIFPEFFRAALTIFDRLSKLTQGFEPESRILIRAEPLLDLLELSGYAELVSAVQGGSYGGVCRGEWDKYLAAHPHPGEIIKFLAANMSFKSRAFRLAPRDMIRMNWSTRFDRLLIEKGLAIERYGSSHGREPLPEKKDHASPLVRALPEDGLDGMLHARDIFAAVYLAARPEAGDVSFGRAVEEFRSDFQDS